MGLNTAMTGKMKKTNPTHRPICGSFTDKNAAAINNTNTMPEYLRKLIMTRLSVGLAFHKPYTLKKDKPKMG